MIEGELRKDIFNWLNTLLANAVKMGVGLAAGVVLARSLGPDGRGALASILVWPNLIAPIGLMGLNEAIVYELGKGEKEYRQLLSNAILLVVVLSMVMIGIGLVLIPFTVGEERSKYLPLINMYMFVFFPLYYLSLTLMAFDQGRLKFKKYNLFQLIPPALYLGALLVLWRIGVIGVQSALWATVFGVAVSALTLLFLAKNDIRKIPLIKECTLLMKQGVKFHSSTIITLVAGQIDKLVVIKFMDNLNVGYYVVAYTFASAGLNAVSHSAHTVLFPRIAGESNKEKRQTYFFHGIGLTIVVLALVSAVFIMTAEWFLPILFGAHYTGAIPIAITLTLACLPLYIRQTIIRSMKGMGISRISLNSELVSLLIFSLIVVFFFKKYSLLGVGYALIMANTISLMYLLLVIKNYFLQSK